MANEYAVNQADLAAIADAIREKGGTSDALEFPGGFVDAVSAIQASSGGGDDSVVIGLLEQTLTEIDIPEGTVSIKGKPFSSNLIKRVGFPSTIKVIGNNVFENTDLGITELPDSIEEIQASAFTACKMALTKLPANLTTLVGNYQFQNSKSLKITEIPPKLQKLSTGTFRYCTGIETMKTYSALTDISGHTTFDGCTALTRFDCDNVQKFGQNIFNACSALQILIIRTGSLATMANANCLNDTPIAAGTGYIYVPKILDDGSDGVAVYQAATNWSAYADQIRAIEDYPEITGG